MLFYQLKKNDIFIEGVSLPIVYCFGFYCSMTTFPSTDLSVDFKLCVEGATIAFSGVCRAQKAVYSDSTEDFLSAKDLMEEAEGLMKLMWDSWYEMSKNTQKEVSSPFERLRKSTKTLRSYLEERHMMTKDGLMERVHAVIMDLGRLVNAFTTKNNRYMEYIEDVTNSILKGVLARKPDLPGGWLRGSQEFAPEPFRYSF